MRLALYQPDIPQNTGTMMRTCACLGLALDLIEPAGFVLTDKGLRRAGMDYRDAAAMTRHDSFEAFEAWRAQEGRRLVLLTTAGAQPYTGFTFKSSDIILVGRESAGVPPDVHALADARLLIPMQPGMRSLNVAIAAAMVMGEAMRQIGGPGT